MGARSKDNARTTNVSSWDRFAQKERGKGKRGKERNANITNEEGPTGETEIDPDPERNEAAPESLAGYRALIIPATEMNP